jgi:RNA polymerase sigma factor for flagellar operon FliA
MTDEALKALWDVFVEIRAKYKEDSPVYIKARNDLWAHYYPLVSVVAERMHKKLREVDIDDLISWGTEGLRHAIQRFDPTMENKFETFAVYRIRGSILDVIRQVDWVPRLVRQRHSKIQKARHSLECDLGREPTNEEIAKYLDMSVEEFQQIESKSNPVSCVSIHSGSSGDNESTEEIQIESFENKEKEPLNKVLREEMFKKLLGKNFTPLERKIIHLHYYDNLTMKEIAEQTSYSESRISQMHTKILDRLQKKVNRNPQYMAGIEAILGS